MKKISGNKYKINKKPFCSPLKKDDIVTVMYFDTLHHCYEVVDENNKFWLVGSSYLSPIYPEEVLSPDGENL